MSKYQRLIEKVELFHKLAVYGDRVAFLKAIAQNREIPPPDPNDAVPLPVSVYSLPNAPQVPQAPKYPSISKDVQSMLNKMLVHQGLIVPLKEDGILGPDTRKALDAFTKFYKTSPTEKEIRRIHSINGGNPLEVDPNSGGTNVGGPAENRQPVAPIKPPYHNN